MKNPPGAPTGLFEKLTNLVRGGDGILDGVPRALDGPLGQHPADFRRSVAGIAFDPVLAVAHFQSFDVRHSGVDIQHLRGFADIGIISHFRFVMPRFIMSTDVGIGLLRIQRGGDDALAGNVGPMIADPHDVAESVLLEAAADGFQHLPLDFFGDVEGAGISHLAGAILPGASRCDINRLGTYTGRPLRSGTSPLHSTRLFSLVSSIICYHLPLYI
jgi:hypothetical protein